MVQAKSKSVFLWCVFLQWIPAVAGMTACGLCRHPDEGRGPLCKRVFFVDFIDLDSGVGGQDDTTSLKLRGAGKE